MTRSGIGITAAALVMAGASLLLSGPVQAQSVMQQCGQQYQAAKASNTLNGQTWNQFRAECSARLKATPASAPAAAPQPAPDAAPIANPLKPAPAPTTTTAAVPATTPAAPAETAGAKPASPGRVAFVARERQCGTEWKANKVSLKAQTPTLTWPKYLSQCNARLKAAGQ